MASFLSEEHSEGISDHFIIVYQKNTHPPQFVEKVHIGSILLRLMARYPLSEPVKVDCINDTEHEAPQYLPPLFPEQRQVAFHPRRQAQKTGKACRHRF
jgi:hypothetical protein